MGGLDFADLVFMLQGKEDSLSGTCQEEAWCLAVLGEGVEVARSSVEEGVGGRDGRGEDDSVDNGR